MPPNVSNEFPVGETIGKVAAARSQSDPCLSNHHSRVADDLERPERLWVDYLLEATSEGEARKLAHELCFEQTVELPGTIEAVKKVEAFTVGSLERIEAVHAPVNASKSNTSDIHHGSTPKATGIFRITIAYPNDTTGDELPQFLNVVFGNTSLKKGVAVDNVTLSHHLGDKQGMFPGPKFGIQGFAQPLECTKGPFAVHGTQTDG